MKKIERGPRLSAEDWARGALDLIAEEGVAAVAVEPLARRLGVTKGSFYWHFPSREALLKAALERWEQVELEEVFARVEAIAEPRERMRELFRRVAHEVKSHVIYSELLKALDHPVVQPVMQRVSKRRLDYLMLAFRQLGMARAEAQRLPIHNVRCAIRREQDIVDAQVAVLDRARFRRRFEIAAAACDQLAAKVQKGRRNPRRVTLAELRIERRQHLPDHRGGA